VLYCFFVIEHGRRRILHFNVTRHPTRDSIVQQLWEASPEAPPYRYAIFVHDSKFNEDVIRLLRSTGLEPKRTTAYGPNSDLTENTRYFQGLFSEANAHITRDVTVCYVPCQG